MRIELFEKIADIDEEEKRMWEDMNIPPKDRRFKWRRVWFTPTDIFSLREVNDKESIVEFNDGETMVVRGGYESIKQIIEKAEAGEEE